MNLCFVFTFPLSLTICLSLVPSPDLCPAPSTPLSALPLPRKPFTSTHFYSRLSVINCTLYFPSVWKSVSFYNCNIAIICFCNTCAGTTMHGKIRTSSLIIIVITLIKVTIIVLILVATIMTTTIVINSNTKNNNNNII